MSMGLLLKKEWMTTIYQDNWEMIGVTVLSFSDHTVTQVKSKDVDGYQAVQLAAGPKKKKPNKPTKGHLAKAKVEPTRHLFESRLEVTSDYNVGDQLVLDEVMAEWAYVDARALTKGKGFSGVMKAWNFSGQRATHGVSLAHRAPGSIGQCQDPGRVFPGKKMAKRLGGTYDTIQSLKVVEVDVENKLVIVKGSVPGPKGGYVLLKRSIKKRAKS